MSEKKFLPAVNVFADQAKVRKNVRRKWKLDAKELLDAHQLAFSVLCSSIRRFEKRKLPERSSSVDGRLCLVAQFVQGVDVCEVSISEGLYSQAAALLKQELETVAAMHEYEIGRRTDGKTPAFCHPTLKPFGPIYGDLNKIAHVLDSVIAQQLVIFQDGEMCGPTIFPVYDRALLSPNMAYTCT